MAFSDRYIHAHLHAHSTGAGQGRIPNLTQGERLSQKHHKRSASCVLLPRPWMKGSGGEIDDPFLSLSVIEHLGFLSERHSKLLVSASVRPSPSVGIVEITQAN